MHVSGTERAQATLSLGMDLNLDWMTLDDFQKHLSGEDEILSGTPLSPSECYSVSKTQVIYSKEYQEVVDKYIFQTAKIVMAVSKFRSWFSLLGELRDAVKCGDYMAVKLALNSKEDYNLDQEVSLVITKCLSVFPIFFL